MAPTLIEQLTRERGGGEIWDIGGGYRLLVSSEGQEVFVSAYDCRDRSEKEWIIQKVETISKRLGFWIETAPGIDTWMIVVKPMNTEALLRACADYFSKLDTEP